MRVIAGSAKGRPLKTVKGREIRPTSDRVKESLFNVLSARVPGARFLDLFAGAGGVGIEALSRGAASCVFVDLASEHLKVAEANLAATGLRDRADLIRRDARAAISDLGQRGSRFDLVFVDPPYAQELVPQSLAGLAAHGLLAENGWIICEHHRKDPVPQAVPAPGSAGGFLRFRELLFGDTVISLYQAASPSAAEPGRPTAIAAEPDAGRPGGGE